MKYEITNLLAFAVNVRLAHWESRVPHEHAALGELYETFDDLLDQLAEASLGLVGGDRSFPKGERITLSPGLGLAELMKEGTEALEAASKATENDALLSLLDDMEVALLKAKYLLLL